MTIHLNLGTEMMTLGSSLGQGKKRNKPCHRKGVAESDDFSNKTFQHIIRQKASQRRHSKCRQGSK